MKKTNSSWIVVWMIIVLNGLPFAARSASAPDTPLQSAEGEFRDADTGITYRRTAQLIGPTDVVGPALELGLAPSGKFVVGSMRVIPLDGQPPFKLVDFPARRSALSPDGKKVAFFAGDIWMIPISPETGKPLGAPEKLVEGKDWWYQFGVLWSPDSARFVYWQENNLYAYSIPDHRTTQLTRGQVIKVPLDWSPDGKSIIYWGEDDAIWQVALDELQPRKLVKNAAIRFGRFTADGKWLFFASGNKLTFVRVADAVQAEIKLPGTIGKCLGTSPDRKKLLFYRSSSEYKETWRFISSLGGSPFFPGAADRLSGWDACWTPDSRFVVMSSEREDAPGHWVVPLSGDKPFPLHLAVSVEGKLAQESLSPGGQSLLFSAENAQGQKSYWVVPVSVRAGKTVGTPVKVCEQADAHGLSWSPDGSMLAWRQKDGIWIAGANGSGARQLYTNSGPEGALQWAPNSRGLIWQPYPTQKSPGALLFIGLSGETPKKLTDRISPLQPNVEWALWSPDSQRIAYWTYGSEREPDSLSVINVQTLETRKLFEQPFRRYAGRTMGWSPDGSELAVVAADGKLLAFQVPDGKRRIVADLQALHRNRCVEVKWSPTGTQLALILWAAPGEEAWDNDASARFLTVSSRDGSLAVDEKGDVNVVHWSPNGKWILYDSETSIKTRPCSEIWEADVETLLRQAQAKR